MTRRTEQLASNLRRALQQVLARGLADPRIRGLVTVGQIRITEDLRRAEVSVSVFPEEHEDLTMHGLNSAAGYIRRKIGEHLTMRRLPDLTFRLDRSAKRQSAVLRAIAEAAAERKVAGADAPAEAGTAPVPEEDERE